MRHVHNAFVHYRFDRVSVHLCHSTQLTLFILRGLIVASLQRLFNTVSSSSQSPLYSKLITKTGVVLAAKHYVNYQQHPNFLVFDRTRQKHH